MADCLLYTDSANLQIIHNAPGLYWNFNPNEMGGGGNQNVATPRHHQKAVKLEHNNKPEWMSGGENVPIP